MREEGEKREAERVEVCEQGEGDAVERAGERRGKEGEERVEEGREVVRIECGVHFSASLEWSEALRAPLSWWSWSRTRRKTRRSMEGISIYSRAA